MREVKTILKFKNLKTEDINFILDTIARPVSVTVLPIDSPEDNIVEWGIDFDKIIPEPREECDCPKNCILNRDDPDSSSIEPEPDKPWFNWYVWRSTYWDTSHNAFCCYTLVGRTWLTFVFRTAYRFAWTPISELKILGYDMEVRYADSDFGYFDAECYCGIYSYSKDKGEWQVKDISNPYNFAKRLWNKY